MNLNKRKPETWVKKINALQCDMNTRKKVIALVWWYWCSGEYTKPDNAMTRLYRSLGANYMGINYTPCKVYKALRKLGYTHKMAALRCVEPQGTAGWTDRNGNKRIREAAI